MSLTELPAYARLDLDVIGAEGCDLILADGIGADPQIDGD
jgi:hypothetical protein